MTDTLLRDAARLETLADALEVTETDFAIDADVPTLRRAARLMRLVRECQKADTFVAARDHAASKARETRSTQEGPIWRADFDRFGALAIYGEDS